MVDETNFPAGREALPLRPKDALVEAFNNVADVIGREKAESLLVEQYGVQYPEGLKVSQLMDAIDSLYEVE